MATRPLFGDNGFFGNPFAPQASVPSVPMPRQGGVGQMPTTQRPQRIGQMLGWGDNPLYQAFDSNRNALIMSGMAMLDGDMTDAYRAYAQGSMLDNQEAERKRQGEMATRYAELLRGWGPEYEQFASGIETGAFEPGQGYLSALEYQQDLKTQAAQQQQLAGNAQFLPEGPWRDAYMGGAIDFMDAHKWSQGGGEPDMTDTQTNLSWRAEQAGLVPGTDEYRQFMLSGGSGGGGLSISADGQGGFSVTQGMGGKFNQTVDAGMGGEYVKIQQDALSAVTGLQTLDAMEQAMSDPSFYSGFGAEQLMGLKQAAAAIGIDPEGVTSMESFRALSNKAVLDAMGGSLGTGVSNADRSFVEAQVAQLGNTPEGNRQIFSIQRTLKERQIQIAEIADRYRAANGNMNGFAAYLAQWAEANPLFQQAGGNAADPLGLFGG